MQGSGIDRVADRQRGWHETGHTRNQRLKSADDTYLIIPTVNADSRQAELKNVEERSRANSLKPIRPSMLKVFCQQTTKD